MDDHDPPRARSERDVLPKRGAEFFRDDGAIMFRFVIDTANLIGPRVATVRDREGHPDAWLAFAAADAATPPTPPPPPAIRPRRKADR